MPFLLGAERFPFLSCLIPSPSSKILFFCIIYKSLLVASCSPQRKQEDQNFLWKERSDSVFRQWWENNDFQPSPLELHTEAFCILSGECLLPVNAL
jgi:hypothetical protein